LLRSCGCKVPEGNQVAKDFEALLNVSREGGVGEDTLTFFRVLLNAMQGISKK
jgi:hypothetical protein